MEWINVDMVSAHSHALALIALYLFVHLCVAVGSPRGDESKLERSTPSDPSHERQKTGLFPSLWPAKTRRIALGGAAAAPPLRLRTYSYQSTESDDDDDETSTVASSVGDEMTPEEDAALEKACPKSTQAERRRFLVSTGGNHERAGGRLREYLAWRRNHQRIRTEHSIRIKPSVDPDYDVWVESCLVAMRACGEVAENIVLPRVVRCYSASRKPFPQGTNDGTPPSWGESSDLVDRDGHRIFHMIPGLMDDKLAKTSTYALAVAIYFDRKLDRASSETVTLCMDVRAGNGWPNIHGLRLIPFMKNSLKLLLPTFPERLHKCVVYPVPSAFLYVWTMISRSLDVKTREKICVVSGKCTIASPPPMEKLIALLGEEPSTLMEDTRVASFKG
jgi:CRAL/TRIO domain